MKPSLHLLLGLFVSFLLWGGCSSKKEVSPDPGKPGPGQEQNRTPKADCSTSLHGPAMVQVTAPNGVGYCIDTTEVTRKQYYEFLDNVQEDKSFQDARCGDDNPSYVPYTYDNGNCHGFGNVGPNDPMVCADWCDATAYCKWAGKRLCGKVGGGPIDAPKIHVEESNSVDYDSSQGAEATISQWYNACTQGGKTAYAYGDTYNEELCSDSQGSVSCKGSLPPYDQILNLGGGVGEWEDLCNWGLSGGCLVRGSQWAEGGTGRCDDRLGLASPTGLAAGSSLISFRCCAD